MSADDAAVVVAVIPAIESTLMSADEAAIDAS
jgi:hypothetical protein